MPSCSWTPPTWRRSIGLPATARPVERNILYLLLLLLFSLSIQTSSSSCCCCCVSQDRRVRAENIRRQLFSLPALLFKSNTQQFRVAHLWHRGCISAFSCFFFIYIEYLSYSCCVCPSANLHFCCIIPPTRAWICIVYILFLFLGVKSWTHLVVAAPLPKLLLIKFRRPEVFKVRENISVALFSVRYKLTVIRLCRFVYLFCLFVAGGGALLLQDDVTADFLAHFSSVLSRLLRISSCFHLHSSPYFSM